jgi:paraquat-inducible protein B
MGLHDTKKLLHNERNGHQIEKATHRMGEKSLSAIHLVGINNQNIQIKLPKIINDPMKKWANEVSRALSKQEVQMAKKKNMKKCSPSLVIKGNANQNHLKILPHSC